MSQNNTGRYPNSKIRRNNPVATKSSIVVGTTSNVGKPSINVGMTRHGRPQPSNVGRKVCVPSNLGTINETSTDFRSTPPKSGGLDEGPDEEYWGDKCTSSSGAPQSGLHDQRGLVNSMKKLATNSAPKAEPTESRWKGPRPSSVGSYWTERTQRAKVPPAMKIADNRDYHTFPKHEFKIGMIFRAPIHEEDYMGATAAACSAPSQLSIAASDMSTASGFAKNHQQMTDFGAVYSENRFMVVVVLGTDTYIALPFYTHAGTGTAYKQAKDEYVSVQDHREPEKCIRQGRVDVVRTLVLKEHVKTLHEFTTAHLGNPVSRKYRLAIAHQGRLTDEDTESLVSLFKTWIMEH